MMLDATQPLVSIIIFTYNSSEFIVDTLESAKAQTYQNIELIITDDKSCDDTVDVCKRWIDANRFRFVHAEIIPNEVNTGIPSNINRGVKISKGIWIKYIAGDDIMTDDCLSEYISYINSSQENVQIVSSDIIKFYGNSFKDGELKKNPYEQFCSAETTAKEQSEMLLRTNMVFSSTVIISRDLLLSLNGFDERFRLLEDWPLWLKITLAGYKMYHLAKPLVYYRIHGNNVSHTSSKEYMCHPVNKIAIPFKEEEILPRLPSIERIGLKYEILGVKSCFLLGNNRKNPFTRLLFVFFNISNPFYTYLRITKMLGIKYKYLKYV